MNILIWLIIGGILGWLASKVMHTDGQQGMILNIVVGIVGALVGGWVLSSMFGAGTINQNDFSVPALLISLVGAILLLAAYNLVTRGRVR